jgi:hypothetical protein
MKAVFTSAAMGVVSPGRREPEPLDNSGRFRESGDESPHSKSPKGGRTLQGTQLASIPGVAPNSPLKKGTGTSRLPFSAGKCACPFGASPLFQRAAREKARTPISLVGQEAGLLAGRVRRLLGIILCFFLTCAVLAGAAARADEPAKKDKDAESQEFSPKDFEGLGFSIQPKEGGKGRTVLFGLVGEGYKFVYVFDRSGSMGGEGRESLKAVKAELVKSLKHLDTVHQFQIVFYNERVAVFNPSGTPGRLAFGTDENKERAAHFLDSISADGGTDHEQALKTAIRMHPDVIYFLSDADDPKLTAKQLAKIRNLAAGTIINCVEFGPGAKPEGTTFLETLAKQNGGGYVYIDISKYKIDK